MLNFDIHLTGGQVAYALQNDPEEMAQFLMELAENNYTFQGVAEHVYFCSKVDVAGVLELGVAEMQDEEPDENPDGFVTDNMTSRGYSRYTLIDRDGKTVSVQQSSEGAEPCIWVTPEVQVVDGVPIGGAHLTVSNARALAARLTAWADEHG